MARKRKVKRERGAAWEPKIRYREDRGRWMVDLGTKFTPRKLYFPTEAEATVAADQKKAEYLTRLNGQKQAAKEKVAFNWFNLNVTQQNHLATAFSTVDGDTVKLLRALTFYTKHTTTADASRKLVDVFPEYMVAKEQAGKRPRTIKDAKNKLTSFVEEFSKSNIAEISTADVEGWLNNRGCSPSTRNAFRVAIHGLFSHAVKRRYTEHNPVAAIEVVTIDQVIPSIHTPSNVRTMLTTAASLPMYEERSIMVPYLAIGYFAGLRPENELANLDWKDIDFEAQTIRVDPATAKKRRQRYVDMSDNLVQWLTPYAKKTGKIGFSRRLFRKIRKTAGVKWSNDVMRHSFGSYLLARNEDAPKTALQMGHTRVEVLFNHYRNLVKKSAAAEYWKILPESHVNVIQLPVARAG